LPKVELHLHLEGAIPHAALWQLICKYGGDPRVPTADTLAGYFVYRDFPEFIDKWLWKQGFLREAADFELIGAAVAADLARQRIWVCRSPLPVDRRCLARAGGPGSGAGHKARALGRARRLGRAHRRGVRDTGPDVVARTLEAVGEVSRQPGVLRIGLGGSEQTYPPEPFQAVYERARALGLRTTAHAGEVAGPETVWGTIRVLHVVRIDHGTRAVHDPC
jgi:adenosine deaminase